MITTPRLQLKPLHSDLVDSVVAFVIKNKAFHQPFEPIRHHDYYTNKFWLDKCQQQLKGFDESGLSLFLVRQEKPNQVIGFINFDNIIRGAFQACTLGYALDEQAQGQGYMLEALEPAIAYVFTHHRLHRIQANYMISNARSAQLLKKLGFVVEGQAKAYLKINGAWQDHVLTSLVSSVG